MILRSSNKVRKNEIAFIRRYKLSISINLKIFLLESEDVHERKSTSNRFEDAYYRTFNSVKENS